MFTIIVMSQRYLNIIIGILILVILGLVIYIADKPDDLAQNGSAQNSTSTPDFVVPGNSSENTSVQEEYSDAKTFTFDNFHGSTNIEGKFKFLYPKNWQNEGQYFSPQKIEYYDLYSVKAPAYFDLIRADIFTQTEFKYQIDKSRRRSPDTVGKIDGRDFKKYDLIDYGSYGGESAGRVIIYVGPKINIDGIQYYLVFHFEEKPLTAVISGNDPEIFERMVLSLKFI